MNAITPEAIAHIGVEYAKDMVIDPTTIAYIQTLLQPYVEAIDQATSVDDIKQWIPLAFPTRLSNYILDSMTDEILNNGDNLINDVISFFVKHIIQDVLSRSGEPEIMWFTGTIILPWDVQEAIANDVDLSIMFGITPVNNTFPVTMTLNNQQFTHSLTEEFTIGLLLFSLVAAVDFQVSIFGVPLTTDYLIDNEATDKYSKFHSEEETGKDFNVKVGGLRYIFNTTDFMQGFATGALWTSVDHHLYWSDLNHWSHNPDTQEEDETHMTF